jgi:hypothetical protein
MVKVMEYALRQLCEKITEKWISEHIEDSTFHEATGFDDGVRKQLVKQLEKTSDSYKKNFIDVLNEIEVVNRDLEQYYMHGLKIINIDLKAVMGLCAHYENPLHVFFHEMGHAIDYNRGGYERLSLGDSFKKAFSEDIHLLIERLNDEDEVFEMRRIRSDDESRGIQDIFSSLPYLNEKGEFEGEFNNVNVYNLRPRYMHQPDYWRRLNDPAIDARSELFAHISAAQASKKQQEYMREYFPNSFKTFTELMEKSRV